MDARARLLELSSIGWLASALHAVAELGVSDHVGDEPVPVEALAREVGCDPDRLYRVMRALASYGIFTESAPRRFAATTPSALLREDDADSMRDIVRMAGARWHTDAWGSLVETLRGGGSAFEHAHGVPFFDYLGEHDQARDLFHSAMSEFQQLNHRSVLEAYDFGGIRTLADVGGSHGELLAEILRRNPAMRGVLFDLPHVVAEAEPALRDNGVVDRVEVVGGDFFERLPPGADAYLLSTVIHDWDEAEATVILRRCREALPPSGRVLLAERVLPAGDTPFYGKLMDLEMMVLPGGRERTEDEFAELFASAGLELTQVCRSSTPMSVLEARASGD